MSREFSIRVSGELARWLRRRGPASRVVLALAGAVERGSLSVPDFSDPGPGPERLTVRVPERLLPRIRRLTRSRRSLVALRKLILVGYQRDWVLREPARPSPVQANGRPLVSVVSPSGNRPVGLRASLAALPRRWQLALVVLFILAPLGVVLACLLADFARQGKP